MVDTQPQIRKRKGPHYINLYCGSELVKAIHESGEFFRCSRCNDLVKSFEPVHFVMTQEQELKWLIDTQNKDLRLNWSHVPFNDEMRTK